MYLYKKAVEAAGTTDTERVIAALESGRIAFDYLVKPLEEEALASAISRALVYLRNRDMMREREMVAEGTCRLSETAQRFFFNPSYLSTLFKKETGISYKNLCRN